MKTIFRALCVLLLVFCTAGCKKDKGDSAFKLDRININGVKYLAVGSNGSSNAKGISTQQMLYSIDENGNMQLVAYQYQCDDEGLVTEIQRNIGITVCQAVPVGEKYIWLVGCRYYCDDYSGFSESMQSRIRGMVRHSEEYTENFLIRKSDGKIFDLNGINAFPLCIVNVPGYGNAGVVGIGNMPLNGDLTGDRLRKLGLICQHDGDIFLAGGTYYGGLSRLHDNGSSLSVMSVISRPADKHSLRHLRQPRASRHLHQLWLEPTRCGIHHGTGRHAASHTGHSHRRIKLPHYALYRRQVLRFYIRRYLPRQHRWQSSHSNQSGRRLFWQ